MTAVVPNYRCGAVPDSHQVPSYDDATGGGVEPTVRATLIGSRETACYLPINQRVAREKELRRLDEARLQLFFSGSGGHEKKFVAWAKYIVALSRNYASISDDGGKGRVLGEWYFFYGLADAC